MYVCSYQDRPVLGRPDECHSLIDSRRNSGFSGGILLKGIKRHWLYFEVKNRRDNMMTSFTVSARSIDRRLVSAKSVQNSCRRMKYQAWEL